MTEQMLCARFTEVGILKVGGAPRPTVRHDTDVLIRVEAASVCGSDLKILSVPPQHPAKQGVIMGHEYVGEVVDAGNEVTTLRTGERVVVEPNISCEKCTYCRNNLRHMCENQQTLGETLDGGFAEFNVASEKQLHKIDRGTEPELAVFVEPLSCVVGAFEVLRAFPGDIALVQGAGPIGLLFTLCLKSWGATVIVAEPSAFRRRYAVTCGANSVIDPIAEDLRHQLEDFSESGVDVVVDTVGSLLAQSLAVVRRHGRVILFGVNDQAISNVLQYEITRNSLQVMGTFVGSGVFPRAIRLIVEGIIDVQRLISHRMPLREIGSGLQLLRSGEAVKLIIQP